MTNHKKAKIEQIHKDEAQRLKSLFANRPYPQLSQGRFGEEFDIGSQGVVWQYLNARIPLNVEAAVKFAKGLGCGVAAFSPRLSRDLISLANAGKAIHEASQNPIDANFELVLADGTSSSGTDAPAHSQEADSAVVLDEFHRTKAEPVTDAIEKVLQIAGLGLDVLGGRIGLTATLTTALRAQAEAASKEGVSEWNINDPNPAKGAPFFSKTSAKKTGG